jgi:hypothetical protein
MAEEQAQAAAATPPAGETTPSPAAAAEAQDVSSLPEWAQKVIREERADAAKHRTRATDRDTLAAELKQFKDAQLTEQQKLEQRAAELEKQANQTTEELRQERAHREVERQARKLNLVDEETALALVQSRIEYDDAGKPTNVEALLTQLAKDKPFLVGTDAGSAAAARPSSSAANPNRGASAAGTFTTTQIADRAFYEANRDAILQANREGRIIDG